MGRGDRLIFNYSFDDTFLTMLGAIDLKVVPEKNGDLLRISSMRGCRWPPMGGKIRLYFNSAYGIIAASAEFDVNEIDAVL